MSLVAIDKMPVGVPPVVQKWIFVSPYETNTVKGLKKYAVGDSIEGFRTPIPANARMIASITTKDNLRIPLSVLKEAPVVEIPEDKDAITKGKEIVKTTAFRNGAVVGAVIGGGYGFFQNKNVFYSALIGMAVGGAVGFLMGGKKNTKK